MNFNDSPQEAAFRARVRQWLDANVPHEFDADLSLAVDGVFNPKDADTLAIARDWQKRKSEAGWAVIHWPEDYGGAGATPIERVIWSQEEGMYSKLSAPFGIGIGMCGPTLMAWASEEQKQKLLPRLASGEDLWCQLFSEPAAGSDLAGIRTRAVKDGDDWIVSGQKIWTSVAREANWGLLLTRTNSTAVKHRGLTMFFVDMRSLGVEVRPIRQIDEDTSFNEVFFTDVRIPDCQRLGDEGQGWTVSLTTLMNERASIAAGIATGFPALLALCEKLETSSAEQAVDDPRVRSRLAGFAVRHFGLKYSAFRSISALSRGALPGPENAIGKLVAAAMTQDIARFAMELQGEAGLLTDPDEAPDRARFQLMALRSPSARIKGGTDEILRNIIAERVLGLPADIRADKHLPFDQIPTAVAQT